MYLTKHMSRISLLRTAVAPTALALFLCTDASHAASQNEVTSDSPGPMTAVRWIRMAALPDDTRPALPRSSTGIAARIVDPDGPGLPYVMAEGPFVLSRLHIGAFHADSKLNRWHAVKQDELSPPRGQHVLFVWPEI